MIKLLNVLLLFLVVCCHSSNVLAENGSLRIGAYNFPPYMIENGHQLADGATGYGVDIDILREVLRRAGYKHSLRWVPFRRLQLELKEVGSIDVANAFFYGEDYPTEKQILYDLGGYSILYAAKGKFKKITDVEDLRGLTVGLVRGDSYGKKFDTLLDGDIFDVEEVQEDKLNFSKLMAGRIDLIVINSVVGEFLVKDMGIANKVEPVALRFDYGTTPEEGGIFIRFSRQTDQKIVRKVRAAVIGLIRDGGVAKIKAAYGITDYPFAANYYRNQQSR